MFNFLAGQGFAKVAHEGTFSPSYTTHNRVKNYVDRVLPAECYEVMSGEVFTLPLDIEKLSVKVTHTADTLYVVGEHESRAIYAPNAKGFGTNLAGAGDNLDVTINGAHKIFIAHGATKQDLVGVIKQIRKQSDNLNYLLTEDEKERHHKISGLLQSSHLSRFITGEKLQERFLATQKLIPTLRYSTLVYNIDKPEDFFRVVDNFDLFSDISRTKTNMNVVFLYSSLIENMQTLIDAFASREDARCLIESGIFIFFIDKVHASQDVVYYLSRMSKSKAGSRFATKQSIPTSTNKSILIEHEVSKSFPIKHSLFLINNSKNCERTVIGFPINFDNPVVVSKKDGKLLAANSTYKLPNGAEVITMCGKLKDLEVVTDKVLIQIKAQLEGYQEKKFEIIKNEGAVSLKERRNAFVGALENIKITPQFFPNKISSEKDNALLDGIKLAVKNLDQSLFSAALAGRDKISEEIYNYILQKIIGIKLTKGKITVTPLIHLTGEFELGFTYMENPYSFKIRKNNSGFAIKHNDQEYNNFLQVSV